MQPGFYDLDDRHRKLNERDPLTALHELVDWESFREVLEEIRQKKRKSAAGRKPMDAVMMFKALVLQHLYNLSDDELEFQIRDRYSFCRFLNLKPEDCVPDAKTIWLFREQLVERNLIHGLFEEFECQLQDKGLKARKGQIVDASLVDAPKQRNSREENAQIKEGEVPQRFRDNPHVERQKDTDARWTKKNNESRYGYKNHVSVDVEHKLIRGYDVTSAEVHDSQQLFDVLAENTSKGIWADSAYWSEEYELMLWAMGYCSHIHEKGARDKPLTAAQQASNKKKSSIRVRVEHVFGSIANEQNGGFIRVIGKARAATKIGLSNLVYNMRRMVTLSRQSAPA